MNNFLHCAEFAFIDTAICAALSDEISLQVSFPGTDGSAHPLLANC